MSARQDGLPLSTEVSHAVSHRRSSGDAAVRAVSTRSAPAGTADNTHHHTLTTKHADHTSETKHADHTSETKHADHTSETKRQINKPRPVSAAERERRAAEFRMRLKAAVEERKKMTPEERDATSWGGVPLSQTSPEDAFAMLMETIGSI